MIPFNSTTVSVLRKSANDDGYPDEEPTRSAVATGVRAHFSYPVGDERGPTFSRSNALANLSTDVTDLTHGDQILDENTGALFDVQWVLHRYHPLLDHLFCGVVRRAVEVGAVTVVG